MNLSYSISSAFHASRKCGNMRSTNTRGSTPAPASADAAGGWAATRRPPPPPPRRALLLFVRGLSLGREVFARRLIVMLPFAVAGSRPAPAGLRLLSAVAVAALVVRPGGQIGERDPVLAAFVVADPDRFLVDLGAQHRHRALAGAEHGAHRRQPLGAVAVLGQLVGEATHQSPAGPRDLPGVERELLLARHLERDRMEVPEPGRAAERPAARPAAVHAPRLVAHPDLPQLD